MNGLVAAVAVSVACITAQVNADNHESDDSGIDDPYPQECQQWAGYFWQWYETGITPPGADEFEFSFEVDDGMNPMLHTVVLFESIYANKLTRDYTIWNLIEDDSVAYLAFKIHTVSGANIMRAGLESKKKVTPDIDPQINLPKDCDHIQDELTKAFCEALNATFNLAQFTGNCYEDDSLNPWGQPGFDCDDYAEALRWYLWNNLSHVSPSMDVYLLALQYGRSGHAMTCVEYNGKYWFMGPQTGHIHGPFNSWKNMEAALRMYMTLLPA
ncbi:MAG: hypothetical protein P8M22_10800 [Phycisphaerales bacterium]|nr:hypothetical protein [Phycisphaerales bacterium]